MVIIWAFREGLLHFRVIGQHKFFDPGIKMNQLVYPTLEDKGDFRGWEAKVYVKYTRELVGCLDYMCGVTRILGVDKGYKGFYSCANSVTLTPKLVDHIQKKGGTILGTSKGGYVTSKIADNIQDHTIDHVYIIVGDRTQKSAWVIYQEIRKQGLKGSIVGIPKIMDNDIPVIDKSFGLDTTIEETQCTINEAHVEVEDVENGIGLVKLMARDSRFIAMYSIIARRDVDCYILESPLYLERPGGLYEFIKKRLRENGHMVIVMVEGAGQKLEDRDASGNKIFNNVGLWMSHMTRGYFARPDKMSITHKYIDPTYMIRVIDHANASENVHCTILTQSAVHWVMASYTRFTVGNGFLSPYKLDDSIYFIIIGSVSPWVFDPGGYGNTSMIKKQPQAHKCGMKQSKAELYENHQNCVFDPGGYSTLCYKFEAWKASSLPCILFVSILEDNNRFKRRVLIRSKN